MTENNLKAYALSKGVKVLWRNMTEAEKTQVRYNFILSKTKFFQGDAEKTIGSTANQLKVFKANMGDLYNEVGQKLEPVWNEFLQNLNKTIDVFVENEKEGHGFANTIIEIGQAIETLAKPIGWTIELMQKLGEVNQESVKKMSLDEQFSKISNSQSQFIKQNKKFFEEKKKAYENAQREDQKYTIAYNQQIEAYEQSEQYKTDVIKRYGEQQAIAQNEANERMQEGYAKLRENIQNVFADMINASGKMKQQIGQHLYDTLSFYSDFTKGMSAEVKKQVSVEASLGEARSVLAQGGTIAQAKQRAGSYYNLSMNTLGLDTGSSDKVLEDIRKKYGYTKFSSSEFEDTSWVSDIKGVPGKDKGEEKKDKDVLTAEELKKQTDTAVRVAKESATQLGTSYLDLVAELQGIYEGATKTALENKFDATGYVAGYQENTAILEENKRLDTIAENIANSSKKYDEIFKEEKDFLKKTEILGNDKNSEEFKENLLSIYENQLDNLVELDKGTGVLSEEISKIKLERNKLSLDLEAQKNIADFSENSFDDSLEAFNDFIEKEEKIIDETETFADVLGATGSVVGDLADLFEDDFLSALSSVLSSVTSMISTLKMAGSWGALGTAGQLGVIGAGISIASTVADFLSASDGIAEKQAEAYEEFQNAVDDFKDAIDGFSLGESISYAQLTKPTSLTGVTAGTGNAGSQLGGLVSTSSLLTGGVFGAIFGKKQSDASVDTTALKELLNNAGYTDLSSQVDSMIGNYAQYSSYKNWYGKSKSYISGYDLEGFYDELYALIDEAYQQNLDNFKDSVSVSADDFISEMISAYKDGGDVSTAVNDMMYKATVQAFMSQEVFTALNDALGDAFSEELIAQLGELGLDFELDGTTLQEKLESYAEIMGVSFDTLDDLLKELGISASSASSELSSISTQDLPEGLKVATAQYQATGVTTSTTYQTIYNVKNNYSKDFADMVNSVTNKSRNTQTGNVRGSY